MSHCYGGVPRPLGKRQFDRIADVDVTWHNGMTGGFSSMMALDHERAAAAIILANTAVAVDDIAIHLLLDAT